MMTMWAMWSLIHPLLKMCIDVIAPMVQSSSQASTPWFNLEPHWTPQCWLTSSFVSLLFDLPFLLHALSLHAHKTMLSCSPDAWILVLKLWRAADLKFSEFQLVSRPTSGQWWGRNICQKDFLTPDGVTPIALKNFHFSPISPSLVDGTSCQWLWCSSCVIVLVSHISFLHPMDQIFAHHWMTCEIDSLGLTHSQSLNMKFSESLQLCGHPMCMPLPQKPQFHLMTGAVLMEQLGFSHKNQNHSVQSIKSMTLCFVGAQFNNFEELDIVTAKLWKLILCSIKVTERFSHLPNLTTHRHLSDKCVLGFMFLRIGEQLMTS